MNTWLIGLLGGALVLTGLMLRYFQGRARRLDVELAEEKAGREADGMKRVVDAIRDSARANQEAFEKDYADYKKDSGPPVDR